MPGEWWNLMSDALRSGRRSTVLAPLYVFFGMSVATFGYLAVHPAAPVWTIVGTGVAAAVFGFSAVVSYAYFAAKDPAALRSESYALARMQIERGYIGDDVRGVMLEGGELKTLPAQSVKAEETP